ncbi:hypothetical protein GUITHDRAFT_155875 [Guillardia theta CCMP2712]|uniref:Uncharacterized protein n=1 Tax=Guillardia theta (strain CCMP2712) TaxID=905079 RepID=L1ID38_GUITC|nr:hypothetical protein GUITHDRAFT_155875 [Guillardia theta CCMP2712]EKX34012.1 hypothetical protein GUITHDRAFT_155875 [Guillardia theta CCMP2712]|eukprot:XP_005820992.1 hypothetical protein GUITHDRAFT_155875 [Guillardia theta CCMP2712]
MFAAAVAVLGDSVRHTPGRPQALSEVPGCPMCSVPVPPAVHAEWKQSLHVRWDMHASNHGMSMPSDSSSFTGLHSQIYSRVKGDSIDCMSHPGGFGCPGPH